MQLMVQGSFTRPCTQPRGEQLVLMYDFPKPTEGTVLIQGMWRKIWNLKYYSSLRWWVAMENCSTSSSSSPFFGKQLLQNEKVTTAASSMFPDHLLTPTRTGIIKFYLPCANVSGFCLA